MTARIMSATSAKQGSRRNAVTLREAIGWLEELLSERPLPSKEVHAYAREAHIRPFMLREARERLGVITEKEGFGAGGRWVWRLRTPKDDEMERRAERQEEQELSYLAGLNTVDDSEFWFALVDELEQLASRLDCVLLFDDDGDLCVDGSQDSKTSLFQIELCTALIRPHKLVLEAVYGDRAKVASRRHTFDDERPQEPIR